MKPGLTPETMKNQANLELVPYIGRKTKQCAFNDGMTKA
jgi:hypothetical protein